MRSFTHQEVYDIWNEDFEGDSELISADEDGDGGRWTNYMTIVFRLEDKFYQAGFQVDACEASEGNGTFAQCRDMEREFEDICEVVKKQVLVDMWVPVDND